MFTGSETTFVCLEMSGVKGQDVVFIVKNSATLVGPMFTLYGSQIHIDLPTLTETDKQVISIW